MYYLSASDLPTSTPNLVLTKSRGYTQVKPKAPANPPDAKFPKKNLVFWVSGLTPSTNYLCKASLTEKLIAVVGKYLMTLAKLPLQKAKIPSSLNTLVKQSAIPLYYLPSNLVWAC